MPLTSLNNEQTLKRESEGSPQWTLQGPCFERSEKALGDRGFGQKCMDDRSAINVLQEIIHRGNKCRACDDALRVKVLGRKGCR